MTYPRDSYDDDDDFAVIDYPERDMGRSFEGYNAGAYRGAYNNDLQVDHRGRARQEERRWQSGERRRRAGQGPYAGVGPRNYVRSDARILDEVAYGLTAHGGLDASQMTVSVQDGVVTLQGLAPDRHQKRLAEQVAESVPGVKDVDNRLRLQKPQA